MMPKHGRLSAHYINKLIEAGYIHAQSHLINNASLDVTLGGTFLLEQNNGSVVRTWCDSTDTMYKRIHMSYGQTLILAPGQSILAVINERLNLPKDIEAIYMLKSRLARTGLNHKMAGYVDPGYSGNITLELKNSNQYTALVLCVGQRIGQLMFTRIQGPIDAYNGNYQKDDVVQGAKALNVSKRNPSIIEDSNDPISTTITEGVQQQACLPRQDGRWYKTV